MIAARPDAPAWARLYSEPMHAAWVASVVAVTMLWTAVGTGDLPITMIYTGSSMALSAAAGLAWRAAVLDREGTEHFRYGWQTRATVAYRGLSDAKLEVTARDVWSQLAAASRDGHLKEADRLATATAFVAEQQRQSSSSVHDVLEVEERVRQLGRELKRGS